MSRWFWSSVSLAVMLFARRTVKCLWCAIACEQALLFGQANRASRERVSLAQTGELARRLGALRSVFLSQLSPPFIVSHIVCYPVIPSLLVFLLPCGRVRELIPISDQLQLRPLFGISEVAAYERLDCCWNLVSSVWTTSTSEVLHYFHVCLVVLLLIVHNLMVLYNTLTRHTKISNAGVILSTHLYIQRKGTINTNGHNLGVKQDHMRKETQRVGKQ